MIKRNLDYIKLENPRDYKLLLIAAHTYHENRNDKFLARNMVAVIKDILDKYGVKYADDISEALQ